MTWSLDPYGDRAQPPRKLQVRLFSEIDPTPRKDWLVSGFLGAGDLSCWYGAPGSAKSAIVGDMAAHIAAGLPWFGKRVSQGAVLYVAAERGALVRRRMAAWRQRHGIDGIPLGVVADNIDLRSGAADTEAIIRAGRELCDMTQTPDLRLIVIDTASRALAGGDENSPKDLGAFVNNAARLQQATKAHVLVVHHVPHSDQERMRGHGLLLGACDTTVSLERNGDVRTARIRKNNDGAEDASVSFRLDSVELHRDDETGEVTDAPVVVPAEGGATCASPGSRWPRGLVLVKDAVDAAVLDHGTEHMIGGVGPLVRAVAIEHVRAEHNKRYVNTGDGDRSEAERKAWSRSLKSARGNRLIGGETFQGRELLWVAA